MIYMNPETVYAGFARKLEREIATLKAERDAAIKQAEIQAESLRYCHTKVEQLIAERDALLQGRALVEATSANALLRAENERLERSETCLQHEVSSFRAERDRWFTLNCQHEAENERLRDTLRRIGSEIVAVAPDSGQCDSIGEIYHLLREAGCIEDGCEEPR
jgi:chromosome segregation ATPase